MKELQRQASPNIVIALAGNKADLASKRAVEFQVGEDELAPLGFPRLLGRCEGLPWVVVGELLSESPHNSSTA